MNVLICGSTGLVGRKLASVLTLRGDQIVAVGRDDFKRGVTFLTEKVNNADVVINLAGAPIVARWSESYKREILESRIGTTGMLVQAIALADRKPRLFISTSAVGIYPDGQLYSEADAEYGNDFLAGVCKDWEAEALKSSEFTKVAIFRLGVVLAKEGGALQKLLLPFKLGLGGPIASGRQGFSWIHIDDLVSACLFVTDHKLDGIFNLTAPGVTDNAGFTKALGNVLKRPAFIPLPAFTLRLIYGEGAVTVISGQKVVPTRLLNEGFIFGFPDLDLALRDLT